MLGRLPDPGRVEGRVEGFEGLGRVVGRFGKVTEGFEDGRVVGRDGLGRVVGRDGRLDGRLDGRDAGRVRDPVTGLRVGRLTRLRLE